MLSTTHFLLQGWRDYLDYQKETYPFFFCSILLLIRNRWQVPSYFASAWTGNFSFCGKFEEKLIPMKSEQDIDAGKIRLWLAIRLDKTESRSITIFAPYWIVNKTDLPLQIKVCFSVLKNSVGPLVRLNKNFDIFQTSQPDAVCDAFAEEPQFFSFRKGQKKFVRLRVYHSTWSSPVSVEAAGCNQLITCR